MLAETRKDITKIVNIIIKQYSITIPINDISTVVHDMKGEIITSTTYPLNGIIEKGNDENAVFIIKISNMQSPERFNNAVACLIGRLFLHRGFRTDKWDDFDNNRAYIFQSSNAFQLQEFADNLLMPRKIYLDYIYEHSSNNTINIDELSEYFGVTKYAAFNRGKWLGAIPWR